MTGLSGHAYRESKRDRGLIAAAAAMSRRARACAAGSPALIESFLFVPCAGVRTTRPALTGHRELRWLGRSAGHGCHEGAPPARVRVPLLRPPMAASAVLPAGDAHLHLAADW